MTQSPYAPPKTEVADVLPPNKPVAWGRAVWLHLPLFAGLLGIIYLNRGAVVLAEWGIVAGLALSAGLLYFPARALYKLSEEPSPRWWEALYHSSAVLCVAGVYLDDVDLQALAS
jgi:hypothetical protein